MYNEDFTQLELRVELREPLELTVGRIMARKGLGCKKDFVYAIVTVRLVNKKVKLSL
jgi:hypothetical protein